jgi:Tfp pilus assembly protein PilF
MDCKQTEFTRTLFALLLLACLFAGCQTGEKLPQKSSKEYNDFTRTFYVGLSALQVGDDIRADSSLGRAVQIVPGEPASWANWGILALRQRNYDQASERLEKARTLAPRNDQIYYLQGILESSRGNSAPAITALRKAVELNPSNLRAAYKLAEELERTGEDSNQAEFQNLMQKILQTQPGNLAATLELARMAAKRGDAETVHSTVDQISKRVSSWPPEVQQQVKAVQDASAGPDLRAAGTRLVFLRNVLVRVPEYRQDLFQLKPPPGDEAEPVLHFLLLESPTFTAAAPDRALDFPVELLPIAGSGRGWTWAAAVSMDGEGTPVVVLANAAQVRLAGGATFPFPGGLSAVSPRPEGVTAIDFNYDFKTDLVLAGAGGVRLMRQENPNSFLDVTAQTKLPPATITGSYTGAWAADIDLDGDLDIVLGAEHGAPTVLRNNGDGTFAEIHPFNGVTGLNGFAWADLDADGDPDAALIDDAGRLHVFANERSGQFSERPLQTIPGTVKAVAVADLNNDGVLDLAVLQSDGAIVRLSDKGEGKAWDIAEIARVPDTSIIANGDPKLYAADLDNNGGMDLLLFPGAAPNARNSSGAIVWLGDEQNKLRQLEKPVGPKVVLNVSDLNGDGRLDLIGLSEDGEAGLGVNHGSKNYSWQGVRTRAAKAVGDQRINSFGIGGEMEIRSGLLVQKQLITGPLVHFGLGEQPGADVVRIVWPNGSVRAEFDLKANQTITAEQRLKGSCPFLFAYNGKEIAFVKDTVPWGAAIGLRINTLGTAQVEATEEWYKIGGDQLVPHDGYYDLRITAELWETYYYDHLELVTVDHPAGTDIFVDERFAIPAPKLAITAVSTPQKIAHAWDDDGKDVTDIVSTLDEKYLDNFGRGQYQGVTRDHYVEVELGNDVPQSGALWLIAKGWMHPTDSSINVALSQGDLVHPQPLSLEVPDGKGGWIVAQPNLGFPAGRKKICLFDLSRVFRPGTPRRVRLKTNLEVYWDSIEWASGLPDTQLRTSKLSPQVADLHYRGYSVINQPNESSPEVPDYNHISSSKQIWRDLIGYYTRFGDVRELLDRTDDRYVIMNSGDEMSFRFPEKPPPPDGWVRDYLITGDGWIKDGDYNSTFSKTVLPLPYHEKREYTTVPGGLEDEVVYRRHPEDWQNYHTRYVTPDVFQNSLRTRSQR